MVVKIQMVVLWFLTACIFRGSYPYFYAQMKKAENEGGRRLYLTFLTVELRDVISYRITIQVLSALLQPSL
jgi:hypothetical protein